MLPVLRNGYNGGSLVDRVFNDFDSIFENMWARPTISQSYSTQSAFGWADTGDELQLSMTIPKNVDAEAITAQVRDGVLTLTIPKPEAKTVPVNVIEGKSTQADEPDTG